MNSLTKLACLSFVHYCCLSFNGEKKYIRIRTPCYVEFFRLGIQQIAMSVKSQIEDFKPSIPLIQALRAPGMRNRHWEEVNISITIEQDMFDTIVLRSAIGSSQNGCSSEERIDFFQMFGNGFGQTHRRDHQSG